MMPIERAAQPASLAANAEAWTARYIEGLGEGRVFAWPSRVCYREVRIELLRMTDGRCAYCDGILGLESRPTIDHFRPKHRGAFPELSFDWLNLYPACDMCQNVKLHRFDEALLAPDRLGYAFEAYFINDFTTGALEPNPVGTPEQQRIARITINMFGLNEIERMKARLRFRRHFVALGPAGLDADFNYRYFVCADC